MNKEICVYFAKAPQEVFNACRVAVRTAFKKDCTVSADGALSFGLNFSLKYNMNGGSCVIRFQPLQGGTAVRVSYSIVQLVGARYKAHCKDLTLALESLLGIASQPIDSSALPPYCTYPAPTYAVPAPTADSATAPAPACKFCISCGQKLDISAKFCSACGKPTEH